MRISTIFMCLGCITIAAVTRADAPANQYAPFDQNNQTIVDNFTGLTWQRFAAANGAAIWVNAKTACSGMGMRLPTLKELLTLVDENPHPEYLNGVTTYKMIDGDAFPGTDVAIPYWTLTPAQRSGILTQKAFTVNFATGLTGTGGTDLNVPDHEDTFHFRCVK